MQQVAGAIDRPSDSKQDMETSRSPVSREDIAQLWATVADRTSDSRSGIFGPSSIGWKVNRESALFLGAGRAALLQLAHPSRVPPLDHPSNPTPHPLCTFHTP